MTPSYNQAASNTQTVSSIIAAISQSIQNTNTFKANKDKLYLYCIGHSLGAQICGQAGRASKIFDRITGLDPAGPGFENCWFDKHVVESDAKCVDHIHTDGTGDGHINPFLPHYGTMERWGHIDFYPNGGHNQPGCSWLTNGFACSHVRAYNLFTYTVSHNCTSVGSCDDQKSLPNTCQNAQQNMGYYSSCHRSFIKSGQAPKKGIYYATTKQGDQGLFSWKPAWDAGFC